jgi:uncharacterized UBP type Zn finger protein
MTELACTHLDQVAITALPAEIAGCEECLRIGGRWVHLRMCTTCGRIGCCDSSPNRHASRHASEAAHPIARSAEPGEEWLWCYVDDLAFALTDGTGTAGPPG